MTFGNHLTNFVLGTSLLAGAFGADWFYLSRSSSTFIAIGTVSNITTSTIIMFGNIIRVVVCLSPLQCIAVEGEAAVSGFAHHDHRGLDLCHDHFHACLQVINAKWNIYDILAQ